MDKKEITKRLAFIAMTDGSLTMHKGCVNASFSMSMRKENRDFVEYIKEPLDAIDVGNYIKENGKHVSLVSRVHPFLTTLYNRIYPVGRKEISVHDLKLLDWEAMAIMYMADGSIQKSGRVWYPMLNFCRWTYPELQWLSHQFKDRLGFPSSVMKAGKYYKLGVPRSHVDMFFDNIKPWLFPSFAYKHPDGRPPIKG